MPKTKWIFLGIAVIIILLLYKFWYLDYKIEAYKDIPDLSNEYNVEAEMPQALQERWNYKLRTKPGMREADMIFQR